MFQVWLLTATKTRLVQAQRQWSEGNCPKSTEKGIRSNSWQFETRISICYILTSYATSLQTWSDSCFKTYGIRTNRRVSHSDSITRLVAVSRDRSSVQITQTWWSCKVLRTIRWSCSFSFWRGQHQSDPMVLLLHWREWWQHSCKYQWNVQRRGEERDQKLYATSTRKNRC